MKSKIPILLAFLGLCSAPAVFGQTMSQTFFLGTADEFAILSYAGVTNATVGGDTVVDGGHIGVFPLDSITGFPPGELEAPYQFYAGTQEAADAQDSLTEAYDFAAAMTPTVTLNSAQLGGLTLTPGVYNFHPDFPAALLTGTLTLDAEGDPNAEFVFQIESTITTAADSLIVTINNPDPDPPGDPLCSVFWQVGSSATLGADSIFMGHIMAQANISLGEGAEVYGSLLARTEAVTLIDNTITNCAVIPEPASIAFLLLGAGLLFGRRRRA